MSRHDVEHKRKRNKATSDALKRMVYHCPSCSRGQTRRPFNVGGGQLVWECIYCKHEWSAASTPQ